LHNQNGQLINQSNSDKPILNYQSQIDTKNLQKGIYLLKIDAGDRSVIRKIIKD
jgi:Secretion system C-terminal sorting domain